MTQTVGLGPIELTKERVACHFQAMSAHLQVPAERIEINVQQGENVSTHRGNHGNEERLSFLRLSHASAQQATVGKDFFSCRCTKSVREMRSRAYVIEPGTQ